MFHDCDDFHELVLLLSLAGPFRANEDKLCLVKSSSCGFLEVSCNLRSCGPKAKKKFVKEVEVEQVVVV